jgi:hypothetical protein
VENKKMKEKNKKMFDFLVPLVAFVVIAQSVVIISSFKKISDIQEVKKSVVAGSREVVPQKPVYDLVFSTPTTEMEKGKSYPVTLKATSDTKNNVDAVSIFIKYDKEAFKVSDLEFSDKLPKPAISRISTKVGMIIVHHFIADADGIAIDKNETFDLLDFDIVPQKEGEFSFEISTGNNELDSVTMIVDNATIKLLPFSSEALNIEVK